MALARVIEHSNKPALKDLEMAVDETNYVKGTMGVDGHKKTFGGFMGTTVYGGAGLALVVILMNGCSQLLCENDNIL